MELINRNETLYRISPDKEISREDLIYHKYLQSLDEIPEHWRERKFADFDNTDLKDIAEKLKQWDFVTPSSASILSPMNGIGKTHLATCILKKFIFSKVERSFDRFIELAGDSFIDINNWVTEKLNVKCLFLSEKKLGLMIQDSFKKDKLGSSQLEILESYCKLDFLVIDDCFAMSENEFERKNIFYIIDERIEWGNKPTLITSNLNLKAISGIDTRIADRLRSPLLFQLTDETINSFRK